MRHLCHSKATKACFIPHVKRCSEIFCKLCVSTHGPADTSLAPCQPAWLASSSREKLFANKLPFAHESKQKDFSLQTARPDPNLHTSLSEGPPNLQSN